MIHRIYSSDRRFKTVELTDGLSAIVARRATDSTIHQTRNRAGKSSLVDIVRFLLGGNADSDSLFRQPDVRDHRFGMEFDLAGSRVRVERSGRSHAKVVVEGENAGWLALTESDPKTGEPTLSTADWKRVLWQQMFGFGDDVAESVGAPTALTLLGYFARRDRGGGMDDTRKHNAQMGSDLIQPALSFLLNLDWTIPARWIGIRAREKQNQALRNSVRSGELSTIIGDATSLRSEYAVRRDEVRSLKEQLDRFEVLPQYRELEQEASDIAIRLGAISDENIMAARSLDDIRDSLERETPPPVADVTRLYEEAGLLLPQAVRRTYDDVLAFHASVVRNRRAYLEAERDSLARATEGRTREQSRLAARQQELLTILRPAGPMDQQTDMRTELARKTAVVEDLKRRLEKADQFEQTGAELTVERQALRLRLIQEHQEEREQIEHAIAIFGRYSAALYDTPGRLEISATANGPEFKTTIAGGLSGGVSNMQVFCFDMTMMQICCERGIGPGFLIHDSHLFDGVDARQAALALQSGRDAANRFGFQYVVTLNSDTLSPELLDVFDPMPYAVPVSLTDDEEDGGLFGFRFG